MVHSQMRDRASLPRQTAVIFHDVWTAYIEKHRTRFKYGSACGILRALHDKPLQAVS